MKSNLAHRSDYGPSTISQIAIDILAVIAGTIVLSIIAGSMIGIGCVIFLL